MYVFKLKNSGALWGSLCGWFSEVSVSPPYVLGTEAAGRGDKAQRRDSRHYRGPPGWLQDPGLFMSGVLEGPARGLFAWWLQLFSIAVIRMTTSLGARNNTSLLAHSSVCQKSGWAGLVSLLQVSQGQGQSVERPGLFSGGAGGDSAPRLIQVVGRVLSFVAAPLSSCSLLGVWEPLSAC